MLSNKVVDGRWQCSRCWVAMIVMHRITLSECSAHNFSATVAQCPEKPRIVHWSIGQKLAETDTAVARQCGQTAQPTLSNLSAGVVWPSHFPETAGVTQPFHSSLRQQGLHTRFTFPQNGRDHAAIFVFIHGTNCPPIPRRLVFRRSHLHLRFSSPKLGLTPIPMGGVRTPNNSGNPGWAAHANSHV